jgi:tetratricopeptide (TPR) repeat protein
MTLDALMAEGQRALQAGDVAVALDAYERAAALAPDDLGLAWIRGVLLVRLERYQDALPHLVRAQGFTEQAASVWTHLGIAHTYLGNPTEALAAFERAVQAAPDDPNVRVRLATALNDTGSHPEALGVLDHAVPLAREPVVSGFLFLQRGIALNALGRPDEALAALEVVGDLGGDAHAQSALQLQKAAALNALERPAEALAALDASGPTLRPGPAASQRAVALNALGRHQEALEVLPAARADAATSEGAVLEEGIALVGVGRPADALELLDPVVGRLGGAARARALEAQGLAQQAVGRPTDAARTLAEAASTAPAGPRRRGAMVALARVLAEVGRPDDAVRALDDALAGGPPDADLELERSWLLLGGGRGAEAAAALDRAVAARPELADDPALARRRLAVALSAGGPAQAAAALDAAARTDLARAHLLQVARADALFAAGDAAAAVLVLEQVLAQPADQGAAASLVGRALAALATGRDDDAVVAFDRAVAQGADPSDRTNALAGALVSLAAGELDDAREAATSVAAPAAGRDALAELTLGMASAAAADFTVAADALDRSAAAGGPAGHLAADQRAWLAVAWSDPNAAARFSALPVEGRVGPAAIVGAAGRTLLAAEPDETRVTALEAEAAVLPAGHPARELASVSRGVLLGRAGRLDEALFAFEDGLHVQGAAGTPDGGAAALLGMGATLLHLEDPEPALRAFQRAHDHAHDQAEAVRALLGQGDALARLGDGEKAVEVARSAVRLQPGSPATWVGLAIAYQRLGRHVAAASARQRASVLGGDAAVAGLTVPDQASAPQPSVASSPTVPGRRADGSWLGFWFSSGPLRGIVGGVLVLLALALGVLAVVEPSQVDGLDWLRDDGVGGIAAALIGVVALLVAPGFRVRPAPPPPSVAGPATVATEQRPSITPSVPLPGPTDLVGTARAAGVAAAALLVAGEAARLGAEGG